MSIHADELLKKNLMSEKDILLTEIGSLYENLDKRFGLKAAKLPVSLDFDEESLGAYINDGDGERFRFSLLFIGYSLPKPLIKEDRTDLFLHEYAHYMQYNMAIPKEYLFKPGIHGSAWKYCCSLVGAVPTEHYKIGESLMQQDYEKHLTDPWKNKQDENISRYRESKENEAKRKSRVRFAIGDEVKHPKYGDGVIEDIVPVDGAVRLKVRFGEEIRTIDQMWLWKYMNKQQQKDF